MRKARHAAAREPPAPSRARVRRRRATVVALALVAAAAGTLVGALAGGGDGGSAEEGEGGRAPASAEEEGSAGGSSPSLRGAIGQRMVVRFEGTATADLRRRARAGAIGAVIAFPAAGVSPRRLGRGIARLQRSARAGGNPPLLVAIDQEGGPVKRIPGGPPGPSPAELAVDGDVAASREAGAATGRFLARLGINADLAPVLDVPIGPSSALADRAFGTDSERVAGLGVAFAEGLAAGGVAATAKHFPGLGRARSSTDLEQVTIGAGREALQRDLAPFRAAIDAGVPIVMVSSAVYPALDPRRPVGLSSRVVEGVLRGELGFGGAVITDDLGAGAIAARGSPERAALQATRAGADLLLFASDDRAPGAARLLRRAVRRGRLDRAALEASHERIVALKERLSDRE